MNKVDFQPRTNSRGLPYVRLTSEVLHIKLRYPSRRDGPTEADLQGIAVVFICFAIFWKFYVSNSLSLTAIPNYYCGRPIRPLVLFILAVHIARMSFFGMGRQQPTSAEKIAAVEQEMKLMATMHNRYV